MEFILQIPTTFVIPSVVVLFWIYIVGFYQVHYFTMKKETAAMAA